MAGALQGDGPVAGEELLPASPFAVAERDIVRRPDDQGWAVAQQGQALVDGGEDRPAGENLAREDGHRPARAGRWEGATIRVHDRFGQLHSPHAAREDPLDEEVALRDEPAADGAAEQAREQLGTGVGLWPGPGVADH